MTQSTTPTHSTALSNEEIRSIETLYQAPAIRIPIFSMRHARRIGRIFRSCPVKVLDRMV
jgi:hypothetical protein